LSKSTVHVSKEKFLGYQDKDKNDGDNSDGLGVGRFASVVHSGRNSLNGKGR